MSVLNRSKKEADCKHSAESRIQSLSQCFHYKVGSGTAGCRRRQCAAGEFQGTTQCVFVCACRLEKAMNRKVWPTETIPVS